MKASTSTFLTLLLAGCATQPTNRSDVASAQASRLPATSLAEVEARTAQAIQDGVALFVLDRAAWVASDALQALVAPARINQIRGWITDVDGDDVRVTFIGRPEGKPAEALYRFTVNSVGKVIGKADIFEPPQALSADQAAQAAAVHLATEASYTRCAERYNSVALARPAAGLPMWSVYMLPAMTDSDVIPVGGSHRFEIDASGTSILSQRAFTRSCIDLRRGSNVEALMITHLLDPTPTELHVFVSLMARKPLYVTAGSDLWKVEGPSIVYVNRIEKTAPAKKP